MLIILERIFNFNFCYSVESLDTKITEKDLKDHLRRLESFYLFTLTDLLQEYDQYPGAKSLLKSFPCLEDNNFLKSILYGAKETISNGELLEYLEDFFPREGKKDSLIKTIKKGCKWIVLLRTTAQNVIEKEKKNGKLYEVNWENILLTLPFSITGFNEVIGLFDTRDTILQKQEKLKKESDIKVLSKKKSFLEAILVLQIKMNSYHKIDKEEEFDSMLVVQRKETSEEFKKLIFHREKIAEAILSEEKKEREQYINMIPEALSENLEEIHDELDQNTLEIKNQILKTQCMEKIFFIIYKLSQYFKEMDTKKLIESLENLTTGQKLGLSFIMYISSIANRTLFKKKEKSNCNYELTDEIYFFNEVIKKMENLELDCSKSEVVKNILNCMEEIKLKSWRKKTREDYLAIFGNSKKEQEIIKSNNEEQKNPE